MVDVIFIMYNNYDSFCGCMLFVDESVDLMGYLVIKYVLYWGW